MKKQLISIMITITLTATSIISINETNKVRAENQQLQETIQQLNDVIEQQTNDAAAMKEQYDKMLEEGKKLYDDKQKIQQELDNAKALLEKQRQEQEVSRGLSHVTYDSGTRVDVKSGITAKLLNKAFVGTKMEGLGQAFVDAEQKYEVNAIFLASIAALESGWGSSQFARERNNLFGFGSLDDQEEQYTVNFNSKGESIMAVAKALRRDYLNQDGSYFSGATPAGVNVKYCSSKNWNDQVTSIMNLIIGRATK